MGVGDRLDRLDTSLVMSTCTTEGRLLLPGRPLTVTPLQLARMAASCEPSVPHSCIGEIWSGYSHIDQHFFGHLLLHENTGVGSSDQTDPVSVHLLGLSSMFLTSNCSAVYTVGHNHQVGGIYHGFGERKFWIWGEFFNPPRS